MSLVKVCDCLSVLLEHSDLIELMLKSSVCARVCEGDGLVEDDLMGVDCFLTGDEVV